MAKQNPTENSLDLEYNALRGQLRIIKEKSEGLRRDLDSTLRKINALSKREQISDNYKRAAEKETNRLIAKIEKILDILDQSRNSQ
ncbi:hypothetical protein J4443_03600 [Candidatus Woesearchaeota archaeon]|nr:hypothetical protein [Candidatus Woesearchaeota archaeon]